MISVQRFNKTNECSNQYTKIDTVGITTSLGHAQEALDTMEKALWVAFGLVAVEIIVLFSAKVLALYNKRVQKQKENPA